jgi:hypothetical protein
MLEKNFCTEIQKSLSDWAIQTMRPHLPRLPGPPNTLAEVELAPER